MKSAKDHFGGLYYKKPLLGEALFKSLKTRVEKANMADEVDHPSHYGGESNPYEVIKVMRAWLTREEYIGALKFNIHKYLARAQKKGREQDFQKAAWYSKELADYTKNSS